MWRFFLPAEKIITGEIYNLPAPESHHLAVVLRLRTGVQIKVFNGKGREFLAEIYTADRKRARIKILEEIIPTAPEAKVILNLAIPITNQEKLELIVEKATELAVSNIYLFQSLRTRSHYPIDLLSERKLERLKAKVITGAKQCGRAYLPVIKANLTLSEILQQFKERKDCLKVMPWEKTQSPLLSQILHNITPDKFAEAIVIIGPEGGFAENEALTAEQAGFQLCSLGNRIMRLETACFASLALLLTAFKEI